MQFCKFMFPPSCIERTYCMNWSLFRLHMFKRTNAYVEGNSCRDLCICVGHGRAVENAQWLLLLQKQ